MEAVLLDRSVLQRRYEIQESKCIVHQTLVYEYSLYL